MHAGSAVFPANGSGYIPGFLVQALLQVLRSEGVVLDAFSPARGEPSDFAISVAQFRELLRPLDASLGLLIGERLTESNLHVAGALVTISRTMADAYANCSSWVERSQSAMAGVLELDGEQASWVLRPTELGALWEDLMLSMCFHQARRFLQGTQSFRDRDAALQVHIARARPPHGDAYDRCFRNSVRWDAAATKLSFPRAFLDLPRPGIDATLATDMRQLLMRRVVPTPASASWSERVEVALSERSALTDVDFERLAERWGVSLRTLRRRIASEGTTLSDLLDKVRFARARYFLEQTPAAQAEIAEALGYADETSFRRAFKRWSGESPGDHRAGRRS